MDLSTLFTRALERAGIPIYGVSFPSLDRATWVINFKREATDEQRAAGEALKRTYDPATDLDAVHEAALEAVSSQKFLVASILALYSRVLGRLPTREEQAALLEDAKTIYLGL